VILTFLSDYGLGDEFVGVCHGVMRRIAPDVPIIDVTHGVPRFGVREGALTLRNALPYMPAGVHVAVVDPQVGTERRALAVRCGDDDRVLVGPDNGLLSLAWERFGGAVEAVDISRSKHRLEPLSATFHGRDVFAPVAAALAAGAELRDAGDPLDTDELVVLELPEPRREGTKLIAHALATDGFGNVALNVGHADALEAGIRMGNRVAVNGVEAVVVQTFADVEPGQLLLYEDAWQSLALAVNRGDAAARLGLQRDAEVMLESLGRG
jgi:S-adenosyl-L-methionine hydrolase (adenosine-forming)